MFICVSTSNLNLYDKLVRAKTEGKGRERERKKEKCIQVQVVHHTLYYIITRTIKLKDMLCKKTKNILIEKLKNNS